ncbi:MAG: glycosyltransferase [Burkholderiales bacterium]
MKLLKRSARQNPKISLILLDWSVRESFHLLHYLARQDVARDDFEVIVIEYYSRVSDAIRKFEDQVDTWLLLEMPEDCYYHKHLMYNAGIVAARGEICVICDSDAMVKPGFIRAIIEVFEKEPQIVLHLDQFRNNRRDFYPFNYPSFEAVEGEGCINNAGGRTAGIVDHRDPIHSRNYGACMCARRSDLIGIGGADEHVDFVGHICGPYDMTFRLVNHGRRELWHPSEFMYHTWHPGQAGVDNYLGPHDGRHVSTTSLAALSARRVRPLLENPALRRLREHPGTPVETLLAALIRPEGAAEWRRAKLEGGAVAPRFDDHDLHVGYYKGYSLYKDGALFYAHLSIEPHRGRREVAGYSRCFEAATLDEVKARIRTDTSLRTWLAILLAKVFVVLWQGAHYLKRRKLSLLQSGTGRQGAIGPQPSFGARLKQRLAQFAVESRAIVDSLADLVPNLRRLAADDSGQSPARVVVGDRRTEVYLRLLRAAGAIPPVRLERAESDEQVERIVAESADRGSPQQLILTRSLYYCAYPPIAALHVARAFTVL